MKSIKAILFSVFLIWTVPACSWIPVCVAPSDTPLEGRPYTKLERLTVMDSQFLLFGMIPINGTNRLEGALKKAREQSGGDALIDIVVEYHHVWYVVLSRYSDYVTATPIRFMKERPRVAAPASPDQKLPQTEAEQAGHQ